MIPTKKFAAMLAGVVLMSATGGAAFAQLNGHRPSDHTMDVSNHPFEASVSSTDRATGPAARTFSTISPKDRALQRTHDAKQATSDAAVRPSNGPAGMIPVLSQRDRELMRLGAEKDRMIGG